MPYHIEPGIVIDATLYTLFAFSFITWGLILIKTWQFAKNGVYNKQYNELFWQAADLNTAAQLPANKARGPKARIADAGFTWLNELKHPSTSISLKYRGMPEDLLEQALRQSSLAEQRRAEIGLTMLASIGSTAPFVGLFGTVLGIMHAMHDISASGMASLDVVAGPIGDALIATAIGIAVAVPAVLAYNFFLRRAKHHRTSLEHFVEGFLQVASSADTGKNEQNGR